MELQAIDQTISPSILGKTKVFYCPRAIEHFGLSQYLWKNILSIACNPKLSFS
jgi:hypothetical protein